MTLGDEWMKMTGGGKSTSAYSAPVKKKKKKKKKQMLQQFKEDAAEFKRRRIDSIVDANCALCRGCHRESESQPVNHAAWLESYLGKGFAEILNEKLNGGQRMKQHDKDEMYKHMKGQWEKLYAARMAGEQGYVEITDWI